MILLREPNPNIRNFQKGEKPKAEDKVLCQLQGPNEVK